MRTDTKLNAKKNTNTSATRHLSSANRHSNIFLIEMMISILFFSLAAAICIQLFAHAKELSRNSRALTESIVLSENVSEVFKLCDTSLKPLQDSYEQMQTSCTEKGSTSDSLTIFYNDAFQVCTPDTAAYALTIHAEFTSYLAFADIQVNQITATLPADANASATQDLSNISSDPIYGVRVSHTTNQEVY